MTVSVKGVWLLVDKDTIVSQQYIAEVQHLYSCRFSELLSCPPLSAVGNTLTMDNPISNTMNVSLKYRHFYSQYYLTFPPKFLLTEFVSFSKWHIWISHEVLSSLNMSTCSSVLYWHVLFHRVSLSTCLNMLVPARQIPLHLQDPSRCFCINIPWENDPTFLSCLENT